MTIIRTIPEEEATGVVAEHYADDIESFGHVLPHTKVMMMNPEADAAWESLIGAVARPLGFRRYELVTLAAAESLGSQACRLAHGQRSRREFDDAQLERIARDFHDADLTEAEVAMMEFAAKLSTDSASMTEADSLRLREVGFTDVEIINITLTAAARNYYSRTLHALAVEVDVPQALTPALREALTGTA
ncbi:carboxymuconolactone decarboxylase family protein [Naasia lichenicola]|uniref:Carboxymuconolactone decarboxylase family protein n=1 Tax=Naasia lichenicola TaxID=2565933 RepID=A0A4S4FEE7_9MICO|nr:carboxymuconolactone decarboxylase family protein [Naasia lichenicola]THG28451.1 carboxymuconolactone decarboxylase family protein [Naasia lichenicola]